MTPEAGELLPEDASAQEPEESPTVGVFVQVTRDENGEPSVAGITPVGDVKVSETGFILERGVVVYRAQVGLRG